MSLRRTGTPQVRRQRPGVTGPGGHRVGSVLAAGVAYALLGAGSRLPVRLGRPFERTNYRGRTVTLLAGPAATIGASVGAYAAIREPRLRRAAAGLGLGAGALGLLDDLAGSADKGLRGHLTALRAGRPSTGLIKLVGLSALGVLAAGPVAGDLPDRIISGGVVAGTANLVNLLDLRPGRALKAVLLLGAPVLTVGGEPARTVAAPVLTSAALLPGDLAERRMLGDCGANALGALLGLAAVAGSGRAGRTALLAGLVGVTLLSERTSLGAVIGRTPVLGSLDRWGRAAEPDRG